MERDLLILRARPTLNFATLEGQAMLNFQNQCLRPILKLQNDLLKLRFSTDNFTVKSSFARMIPFDQQQYIRHRLKTDKKLQREVIGLITGLLTIEEYAYYLNHSEEINKRILTMTIERLIDQVVTSA